MVPDLAAADALALLSDEERATLTGPVRPIVLARRRDRTPLAPDVAPANPLVGLMLPYTPLHHLLMAEVARPLVMTSGNLSEEPLAYRTHEAVAHLRDIADLFLTHDRAIEAPADDSIVRRIGAGLTVLRRSRGYVPRAVTLKMPVTRPVLACGALLKNTFCLARGDQAWLGPHIGDLDHVATQQFFESSIARFERFLQCDPEVVVHDLHPEYPSTAYALARAGVATVGVQHHHAHVASAMAEHGLDGPVLGLAWDGTGYGTDGAAWGGELLLATRRSFERLATFRPVPLAGGDVAIRQVWRVALALVLDAFGADAPLRALPLFQRVPDRDLTVVRQLVEGHINTPLAHGVGRYFDGFGALGLARRESRFEGQVAALWDHAADPAAAPPLPWTLERSGSPWIVDLRPAVREAVELVLARRAVGGIAARFHQTLVDVGLELVRATLAIRGPLPVVLTGGCFQNARLAQGLADALAPHATVHLHRDVPPGDGGLALGQVLVAG
jgi:hydrogenase maturation protein HypF